tara:strand:- start:89 stop:355 length:267 start_codon:yes stop_codon:yes gene_type:complete
MNEREIKMSEEIKRLEKELIKYKWTKEEPLGKALSHIKMEFYWDEGNDVRPPHPRIFFDPVDGVGTDMPVFKLIEYYDSERRVRERNV